MSKLRTITSGHRKLITFVFTIVFLLIGLALSLAFPVAGLALYSIYTAGIATAQGVFTYGNVREAPPKETP